MTRHANFFFVWDTKIVMADAVGDTEARATLNSADFAAGRDDAMLRSRRASNPNTRIVPELSKSAKAARVEVTADAPSGTEQGPGEERVDYEATSEAILDALRKTEGHLTLTREQRAEGARAVLGGHFVTSRDSLLLCVLCLLAGACVAFVVFRRR